MWELGTNYRRPPASIHIISQVLIHWIIYIVCSFARSVFASLICEHHPLRSVNYWYSSIIRLIVCWHFLFFVRIVNSVPCSGVYAYPFACSCMTVYHPSILPRCYLCSVEVMFDVISTCVHLFCQCNPDHLVLLSRNNMYVNNTWTNQ
jgi:hypothetical protein